MPVRPSRTLLLILAALLTLVIAGCGGSDDSGSGGQEANSDQSVDDILKQTFEGEKKIDSGKLDLKLNIDAKSSSSSSLQGPISLTLSGPFQSEGKGKLPKFDMDAAFEGGGQSFKAGLTSTGTKAFVSFQGTDYAVTDDVFQQFKKGYEQAQTQNKKQGDESLATLGIDPRKWLTDAKNEGEAKVGDTDTIKITGKVDINKLLDDVNTALEKVRSLGVQGSADLPEKLTDAQKKQAADAIKDLSVEIYTGKDDSTLRRMVVDMQIDDGTDSGTLKLDFSLLDLNEDQEISEPSNPKPFNQLLSQLGGLGLGGLGRRKREQRQRLGLRLGRRHRRRPEEVLRLHREGRERRAGGAEVLVDPLTVASRRRHAPVSSGAWRTPIRGSTSAGSC